MKKLLLAIVFAAVAVSGCTGTRSLYKQASTPVQYTKVVLMHHNALGEQVIELRNDPLVQEPTKLLLLKSYRATVCSPAELQAEVLTSSCRFGPVSILESAGRSYEVIATKQNEEAVTAALTTLVGLMTQLITAIDGAK